MKRQVRRGVFETNSSSTHSITMCSRETYSKWEDGEIYKRRYGDTFKTREEVIEELKERRHWQTKELLYKNVDWNDFEKVNEIIKDEEWVTEEQFWDDVDMETFSNSFTTPNGEEVVAFGYYGYDS